MTMKANRSDEAAYRYTKYHATREQLITALECCSNPVRGCTECIYKQMNCSACIMHLMEDAAHMLREDFRVEE